MFVLVCFLPGVGLPFPHGCFLPASRSSLFSGPSLWVSCCFSRQPGCLALCLVCCRALSPLVILSHGTKGLWPCVGIPPSTLLYVAVAVGVLCASSLRYSSVDDPGPRWDSVKAYPLLVWRACVHVLLSRSASRLLCALLLSGFVCVGCVFAFCPSALFAPLTVVGSPPVLLGCFGWRTWVCCQFTGVALDRGCCMFVRRTCDTRVD